MIYILILLLLLLITLTFYWASLLYAAFTGAPSIYSKRKAIIDALKLAEIKKDDLVIDLGCGNARSLIIAAKEFGARGVGVEKSPYCYLWAKLAVKSQKLDDKIKIIFGDFKKVAPELAKADIVYLFLLDTVLRKIEPWLFESINENTKIVSIAFVFPNHKPIKEVVTDNLSKNTKVRLYIKDKK